MDENFNNDLASKFMNAIFDEYLSPLISKIANKLKITYNEVKIDLEIPFQAYLTNSYEKYGKIKTIIYGIEPKKLYDFFEIPFLKKGSDIIKPTTTKVLTDLSKFLIIEGSGGIGKSTLMKHLFLSELKLKDYIPIFIELKDFNEEGHLDLEKLLLKKLNQFHNTFQEEYLDYTLQSGCFLFLLDGYDELYSENQKEFFKIHKLELANKTKLTESDVIKLLDRNTNYIRDIDAVANSFAIDVKLLEKILVLYSNKVAFDSNHSKGCMK